MDRHITPHELILSLMVPIRDLLVEYGVIPPQGNMLNVRVDDVFHLRNCLLQLLAQFPEGDQSKPRYEQALTLTQTYLAITDTVRLCEAVNACMNGGGQEFRDMSALSSTEIIIELITTRKFQALTEP